jgi:hypothetical protein
LGSVAGVIIVVTLVLRGFREITAAMIDPAITPRFYSWSRNGILLLITILIVGPTTGAFADIDTANLQAYQFMTIFQGYGGLLALLAPLTALWILDDSFTTTAITRRDSVLRRPSCYCWPPRSRAILPFWVRGPIGAPRGKRNLCFRFTNYALKSCNAVIA